MLMPSSSISEIRAAGAASRIGEWVAMTNCAPDLAARATTASSASAPVTVSPESVGGQRQERLAVRWRVERNVAIQRQVGREPVAAIDKLRDVEEALSSQEVAVSRLGGAQHWRQQRSARIIEHVARHGRQLTEAGKLTALLRKADRRCDRLEDRRLATPVVASQ